ncbi:MAG: hypothetical protein K0S09_1751 [Sphingobacteriaceae bacterium]|jgi:hypothetical protein|nr:hypothetical protein [Sphingobacteriaceae bacterium]
MLLAFTFLINIGCNRISENDIKGKWMIAEIIYKNKNIYPESSTIKISLTPVGFNSLGEISFDDSKKAELPGIRSEDLPVKWGISKDSLTIRADTLTINNTVLEELSRLRLKSKLSPEQATKTLYEHKRDSILTMKGLNSYIMPLQVYLGTYRVEKIDAGLLLNSGSTVIKLINQDKAFKYAIKGIMP